MARFLAVLCFTLWSAAFPAVAGESVAVRRADAAPVARESAPRRQPDVSAVVLRVIDGDSLVVDIPDFPPILGRHIGVRVAGCDTPELSDPDPKIRQRARAAKNLTTLLARPGSRVMLRNIRRDKYFRLLADVETQQGDLTTLLLASGLALPYNGGKKPPHTADAPFLHAVPTLRLLPAHRQAEVRNY